MGIFCPCGRNRGSDLQPYRINATFKRHLIKFPSMAVTAQKSYRHVFYTVDHFLSRKAKPMRGDNTVGVVKCANQNYIQLYAEKHMQMY